MFPRRRCGIAAFSGDFILLVRQKNKWQTWSVPKGGMEECDGDNWIKCALREWREETGLPNPPMQHACRVFCGEVIFCVEVNAKKYPAPVDRNNAEISKVSWVHRSDIKSMNLNHCTKKVCMQLFSKDSRVQSFFTGLKKEADTLDNKQCPEKTLDRCPGKKKLAWNLAALKTEKTLDNKQRHPAAPETLDRCPGKKKPAWNLAALKTEKTLDNKQCPGKKKPVWNEKIRLVLQVTPQPSRLRESLINVLGSSS